MVDTRLAQKDLPVARRRTGDSGRRRRSRRYRIRANPRRWPPTGSTSTTCAPPSPTPTSTRPRATSTDRRAPTPSTPTTRSPTRSSSTTSSSPTATARRCGCAMSPRSRTAQENNKLAAWVNTTRGGDRERAAPARRQRHRRGRQHQGAAAAAARHPAQLARCCGADRPHADHPRLGARRADRARLRRGAGRRRDLPVPGRLAGDADPQPVGAAVADRHARGHVPRGLQPEQPLDHGAHHLHRLRGRRRHRHDREHRPLHRAGRRSDGGGAQGFEPDRLHRGVAHRVADRGADSALVHGRRGRPAVQRVCGHALRHHPDLGGGLAHPGADDVRPAAAPPRGARRRVAMPRPRRWARAGSPS